MRNKTGRPRLEEDQPKLLKTIVDIVIIGSSADERRRIEKIRFVKTVDELHEELSNLGSKLSRSVAYLRLLPRDSRTTEGKRHVVTVPVKLSRADKVATNIIQTGSFVSQV